MTSTYAAGRRIVDIDAHILEPKGWLRSYASAAVQDQIPELGEGDSNFNQLLDDSYRDYDQRKTMRFFKANSRVSLCQCHVRAGCRSVVGTLMNVVKR